MQFRLRTRPHFRILYKHLQEIREIRKELMLKVVNELVGYMFIKILINKQRSENYNKKMNILKNY